MTDQGSTEAQADRQAERRDYVRAQYERLWTGVKEKAEKVLADGETDLGRVHLFMRRNFGPEFESGLLANKYRDHERQKAETGFIYDRQIVAVHDADTRVISLMTDAVKMRAALMHFGPDIGRIIEPGSGWGKNLFNLFRSGAPLNTRFFALELTETGRAITRMIAERTAPTMKISTHDFDYYAPDFQMLRGSAEKTGFFTHHSIEQMPEISPSFINAVLEVPGFAICVHLEPVGWQIPTNDWLADKRDRKRMREIDTANRRFSEKRDQNRNLYPLLKGYEDAGRIKIHCVRKYFCSHLINNATTLIVWGPPGSRSPYDDQRDDLPSGRG